MRNKISKAYTYTGEEVDLELIHNADYVQIQLLGSHGEDRQTLVSVQSLPTISEFDWYLGKDGYPTSYRSTDGKMKLGRGYKLHRMVMPCQKGMVVDHINHDRLDNRLSNLRICTPKQNSYNRSRQSGGWKGVTKTNSGYIATVTKDGQKHQMTGLPDAKTAAKMYDMMAEELFGEYAGKNFQ